MAIDHDHFDPVEETLRELAQAERAGVFYRSQIDIPGLLGSNKSLPLQTWHRRLRAPLAVAACLLLAAGTWLVFEQLQVGSNTPFAHISPSMMGKDRIALAKCLTGPLNSAAGEPCATSDLDGDGDVDLADFQAQQLASASVSR